MREKFRNFCTVSNFRVIPQKLCKILLSRKKSVKVRSEKEYKGNKSFLANLYLLRKNKYNWIYFTYFVKGISKYFITDGKMTWTKRPYLRFSSAREPLWRQSPTSDYTVKLGPSWPTSARRKSILTESFRLWAILLPPACQYLFRGNKTFCY